jgi:hypothetical protein
MWNRYMKRLSIILGITLLLSSCAYQQKQHWEMYRFDKNWKPYKVNP